MAEPDAVGLIETRGLGAAIVAADAATTAAQVRLRGCAAASGGRVTVIVIGDVADVTAAVEAGETAAALVGTVLASHVVARLGDGVELTLGARVASPDTAPPDDRHPPPQAPAPQFPPGADPPAGPGSADRPRAETPLPSRDELARMRVVDLRRIARAVGALSPTEIRAGSKARLIESLLQVAGRGEEDGT